MTTPRPTIMTLHPEGKQGTRIAKDKYDEMKRALLKVIPRTRGGVLFKELPMLVGPQLDPEVFGRASVMWYVVTVKLDLEARGQIERVEGARPQHVRRTR